MKAAVRSRYGPPEVVRVAEVPEPAVGAGEVLVHVRATTVSRTDCGFRAPHPRFTRLFTGLVRPRHDILGGEFAGDVRSVGDGVTIRWEPAPSAVAGVSSSLAAATSPRTSGPWYQNVPLALLDRTYPWTGSRTPIATSRPGRRSAAS